MKDYIDICKKRWTLDIFDKFKDGEIKVHGVSITKELIKNVDEITDIWTYDIWWFVKEYEDSFTGRPHKNRHFCEIKNPYAPKAEDILNCRYKTHGNFYHVLKVRVNDKYGLIDENNNTIIPIENDVIDMVSLPSLPYLIVKNGNISYLYHVLEYRIISNIYDNIKKLYYDCKGYFQVFRNGKCGLMDEYGKEVISPIYDDCRGVYTYINYDFNREEIHQYIIVTNSEKKGILNELGEPITEIKYDKIKLTHPLPGSHAKNLDIRGWIGSEEFIIIDPEYKYEDFYDFGYDSPTYGRYRGSYAQDEMGYSDDDIDTIFDGDPSAYWNID